MDLTYVILALTTTAALFTRNRTLLFTLILISAWCAFDQNQLTYTGIFALTAAAILTYGESFVHTKGRVHKLILIILVILVGEIILHNVVGFHNRILLEDVFVSNKSHNYTMYYNIDKILIALILYVCSTLVTDQKRLDEKSILQTLQVFGGATFILLVPAIISGFIKVEPKIPTIMPIWVINNLLFVCFSEEVVFRGFLQNSLQEMLPKKNIYTAVAIIITAIVFGLYHYRDGILLIAFSAIAGLFYGYIYFRTKRILCAMLVHFLLNLTHFVFFTYPSAV